MFKTELLNILEKDKKFTKNFNTYRIGYDSDKKELLSVDELYEQIETQFKGIDNYNFRYIHIDNLPYHIIEYTVEENFIAIKRKSIYYLNKTNNYYDRFI